MTPEAFSPGSLGGLRVTEISTSVAGPMAAQILGDFGADVIKVERVERGDDSRSWTPPAWDGASVAFLALNRNKKSLALDFKQPRGALVLERLIARSDVLIQNLRPGAFASAGFTAARLAEVNPKLIYCELTGFGSSGPRAKEPAYDPLVQAYSGIVSITGEEGGAPVRVPVSLLDMGTGMWAALAVYEALRRRDRTGKGSHIQLSLLQTALTWLTMPLMSMLAGNDAPTRLGSGLAGVAPYGAFPTADGHIFISAGNDELWARLCAAIGADILRDDERFRMNEDRVRRRSELTEELARSTAAFGTTTLIEALNAHRVPCSPVNTLGAVLADDQVRSTGMLSLLPHPDIDDFTVVNPPVTFDGAYPAHQGPPPALGAHTRAVLASLGFEEEEISALERDGVAVGAEALQQEGS